MIKEFREFIERGGVFEAAVGLIMALAFAPVVQGLVDDVLMPIIARFFGAPDFSAIRISLGGDIEYKNELGEVIGTGPAYINIGNWITTVISFVILAFVVFLLVRAYNRATGKAEEEAGPTEVDLLTEIRDSLKARD